MRLPKTARYIWPNLSNQLWIFQPLKFRWGSLILCAYLTATFFFYIFSRAKLIHVLCASNVPSFSMGPHGNKPRSRPFLFLFFIYRSRSFLFSHGSRLLNCIIIFWFMLTLFQRKDSGLIFVRLDLVTNCSKIKLMFYSQLFNFFIKLNHIPRYWKWDAYLFASNNERQGGT